MDGMTKVVERPPTTEVAERPPMTQVAERTLSPAALTPPVRKRPVRRLLLVVAALAVLTGGAWYGWRWWTVGRYLQSTEDAYLGSDSVAVASRLAGYVGEVMVGDNQAVVAGQVLARLDDRDLRVAVQSAAADLAAAEADGAALDAQVKLQASTIAAAAADVTTAESQLRFARDEASRYAELQRTGAGSLQRYQSTQADTGARQASLARAGAAHEGAQQQVEVLGAQRRRAEAAIVRAQAAVSQASLNLSYAQVTAPVDGTTGDRQVRAGQYVQAGQRLLDVVPLGRALYVTANYKETQLACMQPGQAATVEVDAMPGTVLQATVGSLAPGSGATFALLPPENATGNFTKIVQRVPVRILLADGPALARLRPGLSVTTVVDTRACVP